MTHDPKFRSWPLVVRCLLGGAGVAAVTFLGIRFGADLSIVQLAFLLVISLLAVMGGLIAPLMTSAIAVASLSYFFMAPRFEFRVEAAHDVAATLVFLAASVAITLLLERSRILARNAIRSNLESAKLAAIVSFSDDAIISKSLEGIVTSWNSSATRIFGYSAEEMVGQSIMRLIPDELQEEEREILNRLRQGQRIQHFETERVTKHGRRVNISLTISPLLDATGKVVGIAKVARDITEAVNARAALAHAARMSTVGELTAAIAHEVNQPLAGLVSSGNACLRWLKAEPPNIAAARESVERMVNAGTRAGEVTRRIRALIAKAPPQQNRLDINETINEVAALIRKELHHGGIKFRTTLAKELPPTLGDRVQLQQVILNLMLNAVEAMIGVAQPRELLVASAKKDSRLVVSITDSGKGLDAEALNRSFEAFFTTKAQGMGMGLAISRTIIEAHGGRIWAEPNHPRGAVFQFALPCQVAP